MNSGLTRGWSLHPQLAQDTVPVGDLPLARALMSITQCDKLNIAALGNQVPQLHVHIIARRHNDAAWPKPVWGVKPPLAYNDSQQASLLGALRQSLKASGLSDMDH